MIESSGGGDSPGGVLETREEAETDSAEIVRFWREQLRVADAAEKEWRKEAKRAVSTYEQSEDGDKQRFNILYSNIETLLPSVFNSLPQPDIRRRFGDGSAVDRVAAQALERANIYCLDAFDAEEELRLGVLDGLLVGRGVTRVRYEPDMDDMGNVTGAKVYDEHIHWEDYRQSPAGQWRDVRWVAYRHLFTREQLVALNPEIGGQVGLGVSVGGMSEEDMPDDGPDIYKRSVTWEIWDRERREVVFVSEDWSDSPIASVPDPYGLKDFWPQPKPFYDMLSSTSLVPQCPYTQYKQQAEELNNVSKRIIALVSVLKWRGVAAGQADFLAKLENAADGTLVPMADVDLQGVLAASGSDLEKLIWLWPIDKAVVVLRELIAYRESVKQTIYEITGISDIVRGATDPNETLGAQQLKSQWGSLRLQRRQKDVARLCRDLMRIKTELIAEKMPIEQLAEISGIQLPDANMKMQAQQSLMMIQQAQMQAQAAGVAPDPAAMQQGMQAAEQAQQILAQPTWEEVQQVISADTLRCYRIDIETDSTIREDVTRAQQNLSQFVMSVGQLLSGALPLIQVKPDMMPVVLATFKATARSFKLGREVEDAIEAVGPEVQVAPPPDPEAQRKAAVEDRDAEHKMRREEREMDGNNQARMRAMELGAQTGMPVQIPEIGGGGGGDQMGAVLAALQQLQATAAAPRRLVKLPDGSKVAVPESLQ